MLEELLESIKNVKAECSSYKPVSYTSDDTGFNVKLLREDSDNYYFVEVWIVGDDVIADWHQYSFAVDNADDMARKAVQENADEFACATSEAICYLESLGLIVQDNDGNWSYGQVHDQQKLFDTTGDEHYEVWLLGYTKDGDPTDYESLLETFASKQQAIDYATEVEQAIGLDAEYLGADTAIVTIEVETVVEVDKGTFENVNTVYLKQIWNKNGK